MHAAMMNIGINFHPYGNHPASWLVADAPLGAEVKVSHYANVAQIAERGLFDLVFFADVPAIRDGSIEAISRWPLYAAQFEPVSILGALSVATSLIGIAATVSTSFCEPYNVARQFASLDHLSGGRVGVNVVTTSQPAAALNFGNAPRSEHADRYAKAKEFVAILSGLWSSWDDDAFLHDRSSGRFFDPAKLHRLNFSGKHFSVRGPLNVPRTPQGQPVIIQAGGSEAGRELAAETADVIFTSERTLEQGRQFYSDVKARLKKYGRSPGDLKILSGIHPIVGRTRSEAEDRLGQLNERLHSVVGREILSIDLDYVDLSDVKDDDAFPISRIPAETEGGKSFLGHVRKIVGEGNPTLRDVYTRYAIGRGGNVVVGSATDIADLMEQWFKEEAADGFMLGISYLPSGLTDFVELVVPELQRRGLFRKAYSGSTLREHLGLKRRGGTAI